MNRKELIEWLYNNNLLIKTENGLRLSTGTSRTLNKNPDILESIRNLVNIESNDISELLYNLIYPECDKTCRVCGKPVPFYKFYYGYKDTCSKECTLKFNREKTSETKLERYGSSNFNNYEKQKETKLKKYGDPTFTNQEKRKETLLRKGYQNINLNFKEEELIKKIDLPKGLKRLSEFLINRKFDNPSFYKRDDEFYLQSKFGLFREEGCKDWDHLKSIFNSILLYEINVSYNDFINDILYNLPKEFPYPQYSKEELFNSFRNLEREDINNTNVNNSKIGNIIIRGFHKSIWECYTDGRMSPKEAYKNESILKQIVENRIVYSEYLTPNSIINAFNVSKIAPKVTVFSPIKAKYIVKKYLNKYGEVFDPFSGFSGRMLGSVVSNKFYFGQDINEKEVRESNEIIEFFNIKNAKVIQKDIFESEGKYECLFTCPPYSFKENWNNKDQRNLKCDEWINECLKRFECKRYIFVVDNTEKYKDNIVEVFNNKSHFSKSKESIVLIDN